MSTPTLRGKKCKLPHHTLNQYLKLGRSTIEVVTGQSTPSPNFFRSRGSRDERKKEEEKSGSSLSPLIALSVHFLCFNELNPVHTQAKCKLTHHTLIHYLQLAGITIVSRPIHTAPLFFLNHTATAMKERRRREIWSSLIFYNVGSPARATSCS